MSAKLFIFNIIISLLMINMVYISNAFVESTCDYSCSLNSNGKPCKNALNLFDITCIDYLVDTNICPTNYDDCTNHPNPCDQPCGESTNKLPCINIKPDDNTCYPYLQGFGCPVRSRDCSAPHVPCEYCSIPTPCLSDKWMYGDYRCSIKSYDPFEMDWFCPPETILCEWNPTQSPTVSPVVPPTNSPTVLTVTPTNNPTDTPTLSPVTETPTNMPSISPVIPTKSPILSPTKSPYMEPTLSPIDPTASPIPSPTTSPVNPTESPSVSPTKPPSKAPTDTPTISPTKEPTASPVTDSPSLSPVITPTQSPSVSPTLSPTKSPTKSPSNSPSISPTKPPTNSPTVSPFKPKTISPIKAPTESPTLSPSISPVTLSPTKSPTKTPTKSPSITPTQSPSKTPSKTPTFSPSESPILPATTSPSISPIIPPTGSPVLSPTKAPIFDACNKTCTNETIGNPCMILNDDNICYPYLENGGCPPFTVDCNYIEDPCNYCISLGLPCLEIVDGQFYHCFPVESHNGECITERTQCDNITDIIVLTSDEPTTSPSISPTDNPTITTPLPTESPSIPPPTTSPISLCSQECFPGTNGPCMGNSNNVCVQYVFGACPAGMTDCSTVNAMDVCEVCDVNNPCLTYVNETNYDCSPTINGYCNTGLKCEFN